MAYFYSEKTQYLLIIATSLLVTWLFANASLCAMNSNPSRGTAPQSASCELGFSAAQASTNQDSLALLQFFSVKSIND